jgi:hypothetical protein
VCISFCISKACYAIVLVDVVCKNRFEDTFSWNIHRISIYRHENKYGTYFLSVAIFCGTAY